MADQLPKIHNLLDNIELRLNSYMQRLDAEKGTSNFEKLYQVGMVLEGVVNGNQDYGVFVRFEGGAKGLIHISNLGSTKLSSFNLNSEIAKS